MRLDIKHWKLLEAVGKYGSLGRAADAIGVTQSALSHRLAEAERRLGSPIFEREGRKLRPTPAGQSLVQAAQLLLPELSRAEKDFEQTAQNASHLVRIGVAAYSAYHWVPGFLASLTVKREKLQVDFVAAATREAENTLLTGATDLLISPVNIDNSAFSSVTLIDDELVLVTHPQHPFADKPWIIAEDLADVDYLTYSLDALPGFEYERFIKPSGIRLRHIQSVEMTDAIVEMIGVDLGISILSKWAITRSLTQKLVAAVPLTENGLPLTWYVLTRKSDAKHPAVQLTLDALCQWFNPR